MSPLTIFSQRRIAVATYIVLGQFTDQGIRNVKETTKRAEAFKAMAKKAGATVKEVYWTLGQYDIANIIEAPDDATVTALLLSVGALGNVRTQCLRAYTPGEMGPILGKMA
jgi:uncharacterized protein with GYD domain